MVSAARMQALEADVRMAVERHAEISAKIQQYVKLLDAEVDKWPKDVETSLIEQVAARQQADKNLLHAMGLLLRARAGENV